MFVIPSYQFQVSNWKDKEWSLLRLYDNVQFTNDEPGSNVHTDYGQDTYVAPSNTMNRKCIFIREIFIRNFSLSVEKTQQ